MILGGENINTNNINDETKEDLLKIAAQLQIERKEKINYETTIKYLIKNYLQKKDEAKLRKACKKVKDVNVDDVIKDLYSERLRDEFDL